MANGEWRMGSGEWRGWEMANGEGGVGSRVWDIHVFAPAVMPGLGPGIHVLAPLRRAKTWMAGTDPRIKSGDGHDVEGTARTATPSFPHPTSYSPFATRHSPLATPHSPVYDTGSRTERPSAAAARCKVSRASSASRWRFHIAA